MPERQASHHGVGSLVAHPVRGNLAEAIRENTLRLKIRVLLGIFMAGLVISGVTAIPLERELDTVVRLRRQGAEGGGGSPLLQWLWRVDGGLHATYAAYPFMAYGTDWLAFGHFMIALAFVGPLRDPVRNAWVLDFGIAACLLLIPYALVFGVIRGIPPGWRLIDCSFGVFGLLPLVICRLLTRRLSACRSSEYRVEIDDFPGGEESANRQGAGTSGAAKWISSPT